MNHRVKLVLLGLLIGACGGPVGGAAGTVQPPAPLPECCSALTVQVRYANTRVPPLGAWVRLIRLDPDRNGIIEGRTGIDGQITFVGLVPGEYAVQVFHRGMSAGGFVNLNPCQHAGIRLILATP